MRKLVAWLVVPLARHLKASAQASSTHPVVKLAAWSDSTWKRTAWSPMQCRVRMSMARTCKAWLIDWWWMAWHVHTERPAALTSWPRRKRKQYQVWWTGLGGLAHCCCAQKCNGLAIQRWAMQLRGRQYERQQPAGTHNGGAGGLVVMKQVAACGTAGGNATDRGGCCIPGLGVRC